MQKPPTGGKWEIGILRPRTHRDVLESRLKELEVDPGSLPKGFVVELIAHLHRHFVAERKARIKRKDATGKVARKLTPFSFHITQAAMLVALALSPRKAARRFADGRPVPKRRLVENVRPVFKKYGLKISVPSA